MKVQIGSAGKAADLITQTVVMCRENEKPGLLEREVEKAKETQTMIFVNTIKARFFVHADSAFSIPCVSSSCIRGRPPPLVLRRQR